MRFALGALLACVLFAACGGEGVELVAGPVSPPATTATEALARPTTSQATTATRTAPTPSPTPTPGPLAQVSCEWADVLSVSDGDTLDVTADSGATDTVRLIGVDAPEAGQLLGTEARDALVRLAGGRVCLEPDVTDRDRLGRLLRYAWAADGTLVNEALVREGMALVVTFPPDTRYLASRYEPAEEEARSAGVGLWAAAPPASAETRTASDGSQCDAAYPDVCIPPPSVAGDLDCGDVTERRFRVVPPDPHGFDRDADGIGCES